jgi:hypothetical protein
MRFSVILLDCPCGDHDPNTGGHSAQLAERVGFEPTEHVTRSTVFEFYVVRVIWSVSGIIHCYPVQRFVLTSPSGAVLCYLVLSTTCQQTRIIDLRRCWKHMALRLLDQSGEPSPLVDKGLSSRTASPSVVKSKTITSIPCSSSTTVSLETIPEFVKILNRSLSMP